ncbi:DUF4250 domain-containing protein [Petrocella sp. FN5]|uniref:DUF4250 domain-containing protein n=1 Tax=Petrocella sp. FN5 TaxID=3032002 RepID=UPI0023DB4ABC|nr:DUF4250 domain-containing protein [Petrocella sp. FN5]MDF1617682.1 DUF4250 domain-containing protein [Petrocella sp. FN5]
MLPQDPFILLSMINMKLRDHHKSLDDYCISENYQKHQILETLAKVNYVYDSKTNQFK